MLTSTGLGEKLTSTLSRQAGGRDHPGDGRMNRPDGTLGGSVFEMLNTEIPGVHWVGSIQDRRLETILESQIQDRSPVHAETTAEIVID